MLSAAKHPAAGWGSRVASMCVAVAGLAMAVFAFLPWFDFRSFSVSGIDLPGLDGEMFLVFSLAVVVAGFAAIRRHGPLPLVVALFSGTAAFAVCAKQVLSDWQAGACFGVAPTDNFICRIDYSGTDVFVTWTTGVGSPGAALWTAAGLSAFVSLLAGWRLVARPRLSTAGTPTKISEGWT